MKKEIQKKVQAESQPYKRKNKIRERVQVEICGKINERRVFIRNFHGAVPGGNSATALSPNILAYFDKMNASQAAALYNAGVPGSVLGKGNGGKVSFNGKKYSPNDANTIKNAYQAKLADDKRKRKEQELSDAKTAAEGKIKASQKETGKPEITDPELNKHLKEVDKVLDDTTST